MALLRKLAPPSRERSPLPAAQRADDVDLIVRSKRGRQIPRLVLIDENSNVLSNRVLFRDDAETKTGETLIQSAEHVTDGRTFSLDLAFPPRIGTQWAGNVHRHGHNSTASTE